jgi:iron complex outermembrane recepter protein
MAKSTYFRIAMAAELTIAVALGMRAYAQTPATTPAAPGQGGQLQQITVTGYIIPRVGDGPQPVVTLDQDYIEKRGEQNVAQVLESIPFANGNFNQTFSPGNNTSPGGDAVNLRNIGINGTLVLIDGLRYPNFPLPLNFVTSFVDLNSIPLAAVDRIEILKDNGTAVYGDDAVAGVVNIILKDTYNGVQFNNYFGFSQRDDSYTYHSSLVAGIAEDLGKFGKLSIVTSFDYLSQSPIDALDRAFTNGNYSSLAAKYPDRPTSFVPFLSGFSGVNTGTFFTVPRGTTTGPVTLNVNGNQDPIFVPQNAQLQARESRYGGSVKVNYSPTDWLKIYDTFIIQLNREQAQTLNQGYDFGGNDHVFGNNIVVPTTNPFNTTGEPLIPQGGWAGEFGPWIQDTWTRTLRNTVGAIAQLPRNWIIEGNFSYGESDATETLYHAINLLNLQQALNGTLGGHVGHFFNPFLDNRVSGNANQEFYSALSTDQHLDSRTDLIQLQLKAGGTLIDLCSGPLTVAGGIEYRSESLIQSNDILSELRLIGNGNFQGKQTDGRRYVRSGYVEVDIPIFGDKWSWPGVRALDFTFSERYDDYSLFGSAAKPKFALRYKPFDDVTFRATYSEGFIVPSLSELFSTPLQFQASVTDPNFPAGDPRHSYSTLLVQGSNPKLKPQQAYSYYLEALWVPDSRNDSSLWYHFLHGFTGYIDWFQIELRNQIGAIPFQFVVNAPSGFPGNGIVRSASTGLITRIDNPFINIGTLNTRGIDFGGTYITPEYCWGKLDFEVNCTYVYGYSTKTPFPPLANGTPVFQVLTNDDQAGGGGVGVGGGPDFKMVASGFYSKTLFGIDTFRTGLTMNYRDSEADFNNNSKGSNPLANSGLDAPGYVHLIGSWTTFDYQLSYEFGEPAPITPETPKPGYDKEGKRLIGEKAIAPKPEGSRWGWRSLLAGTKLIFGINNLFDTRPPLSVDSNFLGRDYFNDNSIQRFFYFEIDKHF